MIRENIEYSDNKYKSVEEAEGFIKKYQDNFKENWKKKNDEEIAPFYYEFFKYNEDEFASGLM